MENDAPGWTSEFKIESTVELDFVIGQAVGWPIGMESRSPPEFRRRVLAALVSYQLRLKSIDYALKRYVEADVYEEEDSALGRSISGYLRRAAASFEEELRGLHTQGELAFGVFGAEITLYRLPHIIDTARLLSNRGLLLEVLPLMRLCAEMAAWALVAYYEIEEDKVVALKAQNCISKLKNVYKSAGRIYGYLSQFTHWGHAIHGHFIDIGEEGAGILTASVRYRATSLALCLVLLDLSVEVARSIYGVRCEALVTKVQGFAYPDVNRSSYQYVSQIADVTGLKEVRKILSFLE